MKYKKGKQIALSSALKILANFSPVFLDDYIYKIDSGKLLFEVNEEFENSYSLNVNQSKFFEAIEVEEKFILTPDLMRGLFVDRHGNIANFNFTENTENCKERFLAADCKPYTEQQQIDYCARFNAEESEEKWNQKAVLRSITRWLGFGVW